MKITDIVKAKGQRYTVYVDGEYYYIFDAEVILGNHLKPNLEVDEEFLDNLKIQAEKRKARERAYYLLGYRDHSKQELYDKLIKSVRPQVALETMEMLEEQGLLNDEEYAGKLARYYINSKHWGAKRACYEMYKKGISKEMAQNAVDECEVDYIENIMELIDKKYYDKVYDYKSKQKVIAALFRLGYSFDDIKQAITLYVQENPEDKE